MLDKELEAALNWSLQKARTHRHQYMTVEHILLALLHNASALKVLEDLHANIEELRLDLEKVIDENVPLIPENNYDMTIDCFSSFCLFLFFSHYNFNTN